MALDYDSHPTELASVSGGTLGKTTSIKELRDAIPPHCFRPSYLTSFGYLFRDFLLVGIFGWMALSLIPSIESHLLRGCAWAFYGWLQGLVFTGIWVLGHECGHGSFTLSQSVNNFVGFMLHSALLTPYFSWRSSHRRHHIYANHLDLDHNYVPPRKEAYLSSLTRTMHDVSEDAPVYILARIILQQIIGFPAYLLSNITASPRSLPQGKPSKAFLGNSHFSPYGALFRPKEAPQIIASDIGVLSIVAALWYAGQAFGSSAVMLMYLQPYLWLNHWIVAITYLHHTHPLLPKFEPEAWTFVKGATATVDREFGFIGKHLFHNIIEFHVCHHLFSRIPHYHTEEATGAMKPLLGEAYHEDKQRAFLPSLWESFTQCQWVAPDDAEDPKNRAMWYRDGKLPPPEFGIAKKGCVFQ